MNRMTEYTRTNIFVDIRMTDKYAALGNGNILFVGGNISLFILLGWIHPCHDTSIYIIEFRICAMSSMVFTCILSFFSMNG